MLALLKMLYLKRTELSEAFVQLGCTCSIFIFCINSVQISVHTVWNSQEQPCISSFWKLVSDLKYPASVLVLTSVELFYPYLWQMQGEQSKSFFGFCRGCVTVCKTSGVESSFLNGSTVCFVPLFPLTHVFFVQFVA